MGASEIGGGGAPGDGGHDRLLAPIDLGRPGLATRPDADLGLAVEGESQAPMSGHQSSTPVRAREIVSIEIGDLGWHTSVGWSILVERPAGRPSPGDLLVFRQGGDISPGQCPAKELDLVQRSLERRHEVCGGVSETNDVALVVGRFQGLGPVGAAIEVQPCLTRLVRMRDRDMVPFPIGEGT